MGRLQNISRHLAPEALRSAARLHFARASLGAYMRKAFGVRFEGLPGAPFPPLHEVRKTNAKDEDVFRRRFEEGVSGQNVYLSSGSNAAQVFLRRAAEAGIDLGALRCMVDFGCGEGRILRNFRGISGLRLIATDARPEAVDWCRAHLPGPDYHVNKLEPPLSFIADNMADIVYAYSVFTHIPVDMQPGWLSEIRRILRPGGVFMATVMNQSLKETLSPGRQRQLDEEGAVVIDAEDPDAHLATRVRGSLWDVYQSRENILKTFASAFRIEAYLEEGLVEDRREPAITGIGQDLVVAVKEHD